MKKTVYVFLFVVLGVIVSFLVHALIELPMLWLLTDDFATYSFGLSWQAWKTVHMAGAIFLLILGVFFGLQQGFFWWKRLYT